MGRLLDKDEARTSRKSLYARSNRIKELRDLLLASEGLPAFGSFNGRELSEAAWRQLGALNSGTVNAVKVSDSMRWLDIAGDMPVAESYPVFAWIVENAVQKRDPAGRGPDYVREIFTSILATLSVTRSVAEKAGRTARLDAAQMSDRSSEGVLIKAGERSKGIEVVRDWLETRCADHLLIVDPYIGPEELDILQLVQASRPGCRVQVMTSRKRQDSPRVAQPWESAYREQWRTISEQAPPDADIAIVGLVGSGKSPIHQRWLISHDHGLELGTSFNSLGYEQDTNIRVLSPAEAQAYRERVLDILEGRMRSHRGKKIVLTYFSL